MQYFLKESPGDCEFLLFSIPILASFSNVFLLLPSSPPASAQFKQSPVTFPSLEIFLLVWSQIQENLNFSPAELHNL